MKVIENIYNSRTGETNEVSWGNNITSDLSVIQCVSAIIEQQRARENGEAHPVISERFTTVSIRIEL